MVYMYHKCSTYILVHIPTVVCNSVGGLAQNGARSRFFDEFEDFGLGG